MALTPDEIAFKRRQLASLREAHPDPAPHVADAIARLEAETAEGTAQEDQLAAAQAIIAGLQAQLAQLSGERDAAVTAAATYKRNLEGLEAAVAAKAKATAKRKR